MAMAYEFIKKDVLGDFGAFLGYPLGPCSYTRVASDPMKAGSHYTQVERRSVTFPDQTMLRGEAFGLKKYIELIGL